MTYWTPEECLSNGTAEDVRSFIAQYGLPKPGDSGPWAPVSFHSPNLIVTNPDHRATEYMLRHGVDVNLRDEAGYTLCMRAAEQNDNPVVLQLLIDAGAKIDSAENKNLLLMTVRGSKYENCKVLIKAGIDVNASPGVLQSAVRNKKLAFVSLLLESGADPNLRDAVGFVPLAWVTRTNCQIDILRLLIRFGGKINGVRSANGTTLLREILLCSNHDALIILIQAGIDVEQDDHLGNKSWFSALCKISNPQRSALAILYAAGIQIDPRGFQVSNSSYFIYQTDPQRKIDLDGEDLLNKVNEGLIDNLARAAFLVIKEFDKLFLSVCIGLQELDLPALITCEILQALLFRWPRFRYCDYWSRVVLIKHFDQRN